MALEKARGRPPQPGELAVIIGAGRSGLAATALLLENGVKVRLLEQNQEAISPKMADDLRARAVELKIGTHHKEDFENASFIIPSPGMALADLENYLPENAGCEIISEMELAWRYLENEPVLAVTGTSGKTTTASLAAAMLKAQGYTVFLGGNIGTPLSEYILDKRKADVIVLEASSFQLQLCNTFCPRAAIILNITPNHLDHHKDMAEYTDAKFRIFRCQDEGDIAIMDESLRGEADKHTVPGRKVWLKDQKRFPHMLLSGPHNAINAEAAWQAAKFFGVSAENAAKAVAAFQPLRHRLENIRTLKEVLYVNDSKCTTVTALKAALEAFDRPIRLLCGGKFKGGDPGEVADLIKSKVREVALFGASREIFENAWKGIVEMSWHHDLQSAVISLYLSAQPGDVVLLAPATSSFDLYKNYMERGDDFRRTVMGLE